MTLFLFLLTNTNCSIAFLIVFLPGLSGHSEIKYNRSGTWTIESIAVWNISTNTQYRWNVRHLYKSNVRLKIMYLFTDDLFNWVFEDNIVNNEHANAAEMYAINERGGGQLECQVKRWKSPIKYKSSIYKSVRWSVAMVLKYSRI